MHVITRATTPEASEALKPSLRRFNVAEYHQMIEAGILVEGERVQLVEGLLVQMTPHGGPHALAVQRLNKILTRGLGDTYAVRPQLPLTLGDDSEPEPDLAVVLARDAEGPEHPRAAVLVVEVSRSTLSYDRTVKAALYARHGIPEYWIVNVQQRCVEVYREPDRTAGRYRTLLTRTSGDTLEASAVPDVRLTVDELF
jgi:Uma2 family endonuclease